MATEQPLNFLGISGSLRKQSYNTAALHAAQQLLPPGVTLETCDLADIPLYNDDVREKGYPASVEKFRARIAAADAVLIVTPEYNYSAKSIMRSAGAYSGPVIPDEMEVSAVLRMEWEYTPSAACKQSL